MRFDDNFDLDTSQITDSRGIGVAGPLLGGGGIIGLVIYLVATFTGVDTSSLSNVQEQLQSQIQTQQQSAGNGTNLAVECRTGADANTKKDCQVVAVVNSVQSYWRKALPGYSDAQTTFFSNAVNTACGSATSAVGPFYCPGDQTIYIDLGFYDDLRSRFGAQGGPFAESYVIAHEYGHHVENITGVLRRTANSRDTGPTSPAVRVELQADCLAGVWAKHATSTGVVKEITDADIRDGLNAASVIGDDRIQEKMQGRVNKESWTHGSSEQRQRWFTVGFQNGDRKACDTFATNNL